VSDATESNGVVTSTGQTAIRDIIADNSPQIPTRYAFGASQIQPTETDTSLTNELQDTKLKRTQLQQIDTPSEFESAIPSISDDSPLKVDQLNGAVTLDPVTYLTEGESADDFNGTFFQANANLSDGEGLNIGQVDGFVEFRFTLNQDVPVNKLFVGSYVLLNGWEGQVTYTFDGIQYRQVTFNSSTTKNNSAQGTFAGVNNATLQGGTTHTLRAETTSFVTGDYVIDMMFAFDDRFNINVDAGSFNGDTYANPELFPDSVPVSFTDVNTRRSLTELEVFQSWNNTNNSTAVTLNLGSQSKTVNNPTRNVNGDIRETITVSPSNSSRTGGIDIILSRFNSANGETPRDGDKPQRMSFHNLDGNPDAVTRSNIGEATTRVFFESGTLQNTLKEAGQKAGADLLTHSIFADVDPDNDNIIGSEQIKFIPK